jgi:predicted MFS family arabinose efflux permease
VIPLRRNREYVALWVGQAVSNLGISISSFAYPLVVLTATGSPAKAGLVTSVLYATTFALRLPAGAFVDRVDRKRVLVVCDAGRALSSGSLALALALGHFWLAHVLVVALIEGSLGTLFGPAESAAVRLVVAPEQRREAVAHNQARGQLPALVGPPVGGALLAVGRSLPFLADAISYLASLAAVLLVRTPLREPSHEEETRGIFDGIQWLWRRTFVRALLIWLSVTTLAFGGMGIVILVDARGLGASPGELGLMFAITAAGSLVGALASARLLRALAPHVVVGLAFWALALATLLLLAVNSPYLIGVVGAAAFFFVPSVNALLFSTIAAEVPDRLQGRAIAGAIQIAGLPAPVAPLLAGAALGILGTRHTLLVYGVFFTVVAVGASASRGMRG